MTGNNVEIGNPTRDATIALNLNTNGTTTAFKIANRVNSNIFNIDSTGNVRIPSDKFFYSGTTTNYLAAGYDGSHSAINSVGSALLLNYNNTTAQDVAICHGSAGGYLMTGNNVEIGNPTRNSAIALNLNTNGTTTAFKIANRVNSNIFNIDSIGNVSTNPIAQIYLNGNADTDHGLGVYGTNNNSAKFANKSINGPVLFGYNGGALGSTNGGNKIALRWANTGLVTIPGSVIIGDTVGNSNHTSALLVVKGEIVSKAFYVTNNAWSDFVFDNNYKLMSLYDVEKFYTANHHLPDVPTEKEIQQNGDNVGQTDAILLQKIEELTLYMVQQQKQIDALKKQNELLNEKINGKK